MSLDARILAALRAAGTTAVSGAELAQQAGVTRAAIWSRIQELRVLGYDISASPHLGYRLISTPDVLHADDLLARLGQTRVIGRDIRVFRETTSTNDVVEKLAADGVKEGVVVFAEAQSKGRGRLGRRWVSPPGKGLWFSILLRPALRPVETTQLTVATAIALARAIRQTTRLQPQVKWPNDILVKHRKVAGILMEMAAETDVVKHVILGIGIDVNLSSNDFPAEIKEHATSLRIERSHAVNRAELAVAVLRELDDDYHRLRQGQFEAVAEEWTRACSTIGQMVAVRMGETVVRGRAEALDTDGALVVRTQHGRPVRIVGGDVTLEKGATAT